MYIEKGLYDCVTDFEAEVLCEQLRKIYQPEYIFPIKFVWIKETGTIQLVPSRSYIATF